MNCDRVSIDSPPDFPTRHESDDAPEQLGDDFEITVDERHRLTVAAQWGRSLILQARAGSQQALDDLQTKMHVTRLEVMR